MSKKYKGIDKEKNPIIKLQPPPGSDGSGDNPLIEEIPVFMPRSSDHIITGTYDNNTMIVMGRDRFAQQEETYFDQRTNTKKKRSREQYSPDPMSTSLVSGYSNHQGAGAIDIVVGRGAPFPVKMKGPNNYKSAPLAPLFTTIPDKQGATSGVTLANGATHPKILMDAARIYITQMSDIDRYFNISDGRDKVSSGPKIDTGPHSAIMIKADRCRIHSRRDIKIVAGGDGPYNIDSNGYTLGEKPKIHLMVGNGQPGTTLQQPVPLGNNLKEALGRIYAVQENFVKIIDNILKAQAALNSVLAHSIRVSNLGPTAMDPVSSAMNVVTSYSNSLDLFNLYFLGANNIQMDKVTFLNHLHQDYILSRNITVN